MANIGTLTAHLGLDVSGMEKGVVQAKRDLSQLERSGIGSFSAMQASVAKLGAFIGITFAGAQVTAFLKNSVLAAAESERSFQDLGEAIRLHGGDWESLRATVERYTKSVQTTFGVSDELVARSIRRFIDFGMTTSEAMKTFSTAMDLAAGTGKDLESVVQALARGYSGQTVMLQRLIGGMDDAADTGEKYAAILKRIDELFGGRAQSRVADMTTKIDQLKESMGEFMEVVGQKMTGRVGVNIFLDPFKGLLDVLTAEWSDSEAAIEARLRESLKWRQEAIDILEALGQGGFPQARQLRAEMKQSDDLLEKIIKKRHELADLEDKTNVVGTPLGPPEPNVEQQIANRFKVQQEQAAAAEEHADRMKQIQEDMLEARSDFFDRWDAMIAERDFANEEHALSMRAFYDEMARAGEMFGPSRDEMMSGYSDHLQNEIGLIQELMDHDQSLMDQDRRTSASMLSNIERYQKATQELIALDAQHLAEIGVSAETIAAIVGKRTSEVTEQIDAMLRDSLGGLRGWVYDLSEELNAAFADTFFSAMKGQFESFYDFIQSITDVFLRNISQQLANALVPPTGSGGILSLLGGSGAPVMAGQLGPTGPMSPTGFASGGIVRKPTFAMVGERGPEMIIPLTKSPMEDFAKALGIPSVDMQSMGKSLPDLRISEMDIPALALGGIVKSPTLAMIGESGPEAVVPLGKFRNEKFLNSLSDWQTAGIRDPGGNTAPVIINIQTPDVQSFKASESQILTRITQSLSRQRRNM